MCQPLSVKTAAKAVFSYFMPVCLYGMQMMKQI